LFCDNTSQCVACRSAADCAAGEVCNSTCHNLNQPPYYVCDVRCQLDCRSPDAGPDYCKPGACDGDAGGCLTGECYQNSDCVVDGRGACDFSNAYYYGYGTCTACSQDAGGCGPNELCVYDTNYNVYACQLSCLIDAGVCGQGTYCSDAGSCQSGCQNANDCVGSSGGPICSQGQCVGCLTASNCPDYRSGCNPMYNGGTPSCGFCNDDNDCPSGLHCETNRGNSYYSKQCACHDDTECPADAPVCLGLNASLGFPAGSGMCGCSDSSQCPSPQGVNYICEERYPYTVYNGSYGPAIGGACIAPCNLDLSGTDLTPTDCASAGIGAVDPAKGIPYGSTPPPLSLVCNSSTGYCVPCSQDSDCYSPPGIPVSTPSCVQYQGGLDPTSGEPTGGGQCACTDTSQCNDNWACWYAGISGSCQPACNITNGVDSCNPYRPYQYDYPPTDPFCNTWTGACVQCLDNWGCTNILVTQIDGLYAYPGFAAPQCSPNGTCVGCVSDSDCPAEAPNCTSGFCGFCTQTAQCHVDAGFTCVVPYSDEAGNCLVTGCVADSNYNATDAGTICPSSSPYCTGFTVCSGSCKTTMLCAECRPSYYPYYYNDCTNYPPGTYYSYCNSETGRCVYEQ
jgi:hypothetical protein